MNKHTVKIPGRFKHWYGKRGYLSDGLYHSLYLSNDKIIENMERSAKQISPEEPQKAAQFLQSGLVSVGINEEGIITIPDHLLEYVKEPGEITVGDHADILIINSAKYLSPEITSPLTYYRHFFRQDLDKLKRQVTLCGDGHFHLVDLFLRNPKDKENAHPPLSHIPQNRLGYFLSFLCLVLLADQIVYTHFNASRFAFQRLTSYPKVSWSIGFCSNIKPWDVFDHRIALARGLHNPEKRGIFTLCTIFFVKEFKKVVEDNPELGVEWEEVNRVIREDKDIMVSDYGALFQEVLDRATSSSSS